MIDTRRRRRPRGGLPPRRLLRVVAAVLVPLLLSGTALAADEHVTSLRPVVASEDLLIILVIGSDLGPPYRRGDPRRGLADAIHLVAVDPDRRRATVVDIPRDAVIGGTKVNAHLFTGGPDRLVSRLASYTDLEIDHWILTSFRGFERITRAAGGIEVTIDEPMHDVASGSDFAPGTRRLAGKDALAFARDRHSLSDGDFGRTRHQGDLLLGAHRLVAGGDVGLVDLVDLVRTLARNTASDIPPTELLRLALLASRIDPDDVAHEPLEGGLGFLGAASVVDLHPGDTFERIADGQVGPTGAGGG